MTIPASPVLADLLGRPLAPGRSGDDAAYVRDLYRTLLGREPSADEVALQCHALGHGTSEADLFRGFVRSEEFQRRRVSVRFTALCSCTPGMDRAGSPATIDLQVFIPATEGIGKVEKALAVLLDEASLRVAVTVLDGSPPSRPGGRVSGALSERLRVHHFPGESVFHLRARIAELARDARWIALLEDHNAIDREWLLTAADLIGHAGPEDVAFAGPLTNRTSCRPWSWASFLHTFGFCWEPGPGERWPLVAANVLMARELLGCQGLVLGEMESTILPRLHAVAVFDRRLVIDHVQETGFPRATALHFHNGRVSGAFLRAQPRSLHMSVTGPLALVGGRFRDLRRTLQAHRHAGCLPHATLAKVGWLAFVHAAGLVVGWYSGLGGSAHRLE